ncbi:Alpha/Beta hydrolase protein [Aspergillus floccosus]
MPLTKEIQNFVAQFGNTWNLNVNAACEKFFEERQAAEPAPSLLDIEKAVRYGPDSRHRLDIYWKAPQDDSHKIPVVVYFHGGGFRAGDNDISPHIHSNIAKYFATHGTVAVLATYRLLPEAQYPSGIEDATSALAWIKSHIETYGGNPEQIFVLGQSAGGAHLAMALFSGALEKHGVIPRGMLLQSAPLWYDLSQARRRANMVAYYATEDDDEILSKSALGLFGGYKGEGGPELFLSVGEFDSEEIARGNLMLLEKYVKKVKRMPRFEVLMGHNHISYALALGLEGDEVGPRVLAWIESSRIEHPKTIRLIAYIYNFIQNNRGQKARLAFHKSDRQTLPGSRNQNPVPNPPMEHGRAHLRAHPTQQANPHRLALRRHQEPPPASREARRRARSRAPRPDPPRREGSLPPAHALCRAFPHRGRAGLHGYLGAQDVHGTRGLDHHACVELA